jgi:magnesium-transporting ATPase (P-type)
MPGSSGWWRRRRLQGADVAAGRPLVAGLSRGHRRIAFAAWWFTGDPIRAVAVLVVATPCPLILAVPVALVAGLSRAAHFGVLIKGAGPLETMARIRR